MGAILVSCKALWGRLWAVSCTRKVDVYLCEPGTQRHARIQNTGGVTTTTKYFQADQWRWVPFLWVAKHFEADSELFHVPTGEVCTCANQGPNVTRRSGTLGVWPQLLSTFKLTREDGCHSCELQSTLRQTLSCSMYPQGRCVPTPTRDPKSRTDPEHWGCDHN